MRKNSARKCLHATLDLLPVIIIPLFAIFMHRHEATTYEVEISQNEVVDFNQSLENTDYLNGGNNLYSFAPSYTSVTFNNGGVVVIINDTAQYLYENSVYTVCDNYLTLDNIYYIRFSADEGDFEGFRSDSLGNNQDYILNNGFYCLRFNNNSSNEKTILIKPLGTIVTGYSFTIYNIQLFNLTQMFGIGNEPTIEQFNTWYPNDYYDFTLSRKELLKDVSTVTYNNTDIGSQLVYALYTPINDYMNFNNVFNFGAIYDWLQLNIFNGNAPLSVFIVWNIILYEFLMDLIFLLYALFMFFIDFCTSLIDRFHCKASGGH